MRQTTVVPTRSNEAVLRALAYLRENPIEGLRQRLCGAPSSTWSLVPVFCIFALVMGFTQGLLTPELPTVVQLVTFPPVLLLFPALIEEFFYRGVLLPRTLIEASPLRRFAAVSASTAVYVAAHPLSPLFLGRDSLNVFLDPMMLLIVAVLGYTCGYAYLRSGSLRAPILIHWLTVVVWNLFLGGVK